MITETGSLIVGIEHAGKKHTEFVLRPQVVKDSVEILEGPHASRASKNDSFFGVCLLARQITKLGDIPVAEITPELVMSMTDVDFQEISRVREVLEKSLRSFRGKTEEPEEAAARDAEAGV